MGCHLAKLETLKSLPYIYINLNSGISNSSYTNQGFSSDCISKGVLYQRRSY